MWLSCYPVTLYVPICMHWSHVGHGSCQTDCLLGADLWFVTFFCISVETYVTAGWCTHNSTNNLNHNAALDVKIYTIRAENCSHKKRDMNAQPEGGCTTLSRSHFVRNSISSAKSQGCYVTLAAWEAEISFVNESPRGNQNSRLSHNKGWFGKLRVFF